MDFYKWKNIFEILTGYNLIDLNQIFPMISSELKISISVKSYDESTDEKDQIFTLRKSSSFSNNKMRYQFKICIAQIGNFNKD